MDKKDYDVFLNKANNNSAIAIKAVESKMYHVAISRFYYSVYQKILYVLYAESIYDKYDSDRPHNEPYAKFRAQIIPRYLNVIGKFGANDLKRFKQLKDFRVQADYSNETIDEAIYNSDFRDMYHPFNESIDTIIGEIGGKSREQCKN